MIIDFLKNIFSGYATLEYIVAFLVTVAGLLFSLSIHEYAHGFAAYTQGDHYAKHSGRLSLNPLKHLDPIGTLMMLLCGFGWAKPVPIVPSNFKNGKKSMFIVALAGVTCNILLAFVLLFLSYFLRFVCGIDPLLSSWTLVLFLTIEGIAYTNIILCIFNLIPVPPLDGYRVVKEIFINYKNQYTFVKLERYSMYISIAFILILNRTNILSIVGNGIMDGFFSLFNLIFKAYM